MLPILFTGEEAGEEEVTAARLVEMILTKPDEVLASALANVAIRAQERGISHGDPGDVCFEARGGMWRGRTRRRISHRGNPLMGARRRV
jgi:hypothetical protein